MQDAGKRFAVLLDARPIVGHNGNPTLRIWKIRTHRMLGIYNGPSHFPPPIRSFDEDVFNPELPQNLDKAYLADRRRWDKEGNTGYGPPDTFADFEVCPLEPEKEGWMQAVRIESARNSPVAPAFVTEALSGLSISDRQPVRQSPPNLRPGREASAEILSRFTT